MRYSDSGLSMVASGCVKMYRKDFLFLRRIALCIEQVTIKSIVLLCEQSIIAFCFWVFSLMVFAFLWEHNVIGSFTVAPVVQDCSERTFLSLSFEAQIC